MNNKSITQISSISVIIPVWNGYVYLRTCLNSLFTQIDAAQRLQLNPSVRIEVIAVNNHSDDASGDLIRDCFPAVRLLVAEKNWGFAGGCNRGAKVATGDLLVFLNQDTEVSPDWLQKLSRAFDNPEIGIAGCKIYYSNSREIQHAGMKIDLPRFATPHIGYHEVDTGQFSVSYPVDCVTGAALAIRRELFQQLSGFDEDFWPGYFEDTDLCLRAKALGWQIWFIADAVLSHQESTSIPDVVVRMTFHHMGRLRISLKHLTPQKWLEEFYPAEKEALQLNCVQYEIYAVLYAYRQLRSEAYTLVRSAWDVSYETAQQIVDCIISLESQLSRPFVHPGNPCKHLNSEVFIHEISPLLTEFDFYSAHPLWGGFAQGFRKMWYNVAARWANQHLRRQQDLINRQHAEQIYWLREQLIDQQQLIQAQEKLLSFERERANREKSS